MKTLLKLILAIAVILPASDAAAQQSDRALRKDLKSKILKESKKEAKAYKKEGWKVMPGKLSLERQIQDSKFAAVNTDQDGLQLNFVGSDMATGGNFSAAKQIATSRANLELAHAVNSYITEKVKEKQATTDYGNGDLETISEFVAANVSIAEARLQGVVPVLEMYKENKDKTVTVRLVVKVKAEDAVKAVRRAYQQELMKQSEKLAADLEEILPY